MYCPLWIALALSLYSPQIAETGDLDEVVISAFEQVHEGYSSDEVILSDQLNQSFLTICKSQFPDASDFDFNWKLINLRKAGKLSSIKTKVFNREATDEYSIIAEIATRKIMDQSRFSMDRIFADPEWRRKFDAQVKQLNNAADLYKVKKAAFKLRKTRRLRPELITRIADWDRQIFTISLTELKESPKTVPHHPGIYLFHNSSGYLYIGHSEDVCQRLQNHLDKSSNLELARYLEATPDEKVLVEIHMFPRESRMQELVIRRAYESELIRSRKPKFNILP